MTEVPPTAATVVGTRRGDLPFSVTSASSCSMGAGWPDTGATPRSTNRTFMPASTSRAPAWAPPRPVPITIASQWTESTARFVSAA